MIFTEIEPNENFDVRRFSSLPQGLWQAGILKMGFGKNRVRLAPTASRGYVPIDYWGGDLAQSNYLLGIVIGTCSLLPETITERRSRRFFLSSSTRSSGPNSSINFSRPAMWRE